MNKSTVCCWVFMIVGGACVTLAHHAFAEPEKGTLSGSPGIRAESSRAGSESDQGTGMRRDPHSGTTVPDSGRSSSFKGMAQVPAGIGERGTGQTQSTLERSGGRSASPQATTPEVSSGTGETSTGQTRRAEENAGSGMLSTVPQAE